MCLLYLCTCAYVFLRTPVCMRMCVSMHVCVQSRESKTLAIRLPLAPSRLPSRRSLRSAAPSPRAPGVATHTGTHTPLVSPRLESLLGAQEASQTGKVSDVLGRGLLRDQDQAVSTFVCTCMFCRRSGRYLCATS